MSELINAREAGNDLRRRLMATVSVLAIAGFVCSSHDAKAADADTEHPVFWIELGGQLEQQAGQNSIFVPSFISKNPSAPALQGFDLQAQKSSVFSNGAEGKITFQPEDTNWVFSASVLYGRANSSKNVSQATPGHHLRYKSVYAIYGAPTTSGYRSKHFHCCVTHYNNTPGGAFASMQARSHQSHAVIDFQAGRDVGLGLFGSSSIVSAGVRFVQFVSRTNTEIQALPDKEVQKTVQHEFGYTVTGYINLRQFKHQFAVSSDTHHSFRGIGPSVSWSGTTPLLGNPQAGEIALDWGANAAVLFGRQRATGKHQTYQVYLASQTGTHYTHTGNFNRERTVTIPNVGGLAGVSFRYANAKISLGYRGDFFFGAMDVGDDTRKTETVGFYGPFASISVGIGG
jgi:hypothetical protein